MQSLDNATNNKSPVCIITENGKVFFLKKRKLTVNKNKKTLRQEQNLKATLPKNFVKNLKN